MIGAVFYFLRRSCDMRSIGRVRNEGVRNFYVVYYLCILLYFMLCLTEREGVLGAIYVHVVKWVRQG